MGKFNLKDSKEKLKAAAKSSKANAQTFELKRKEIKSTFPLKLTRIKRSKVLEMALGVESSKQSAPSSALIDPTGDIDKGLVDVAKNVPGSNPSSIQLAHFFDEGL